MELDHLWGVFVCAGSSKGFPNYYPVGVYTTREKAVELLNGLTREHNYEIVKLPIDTFFGHINKKGNLSDGIGCLHHEHYPFRSDDEEAQAETGENE
ncbi:MAG: hypothetical protein ACXVO1_09730 [Tumebacillaceae bacterium]